MSRPLVHLSRRYSFSASHRLYSDHLSFKENEALFGKCANPNGHGHNYGVEVTVTGSVDPKTGQIVSPEVLDRLFEGAVGEPLSHRMLNDVGVFAVRVPTAENIAIVIHELLSPEIAKSTSARLNHLNPRLIRSGNVIRITAPAVYQSQELLIDARLLAPVSPR